MAIVVAFVAAWVATAYLAEHHGGASTRASQVAIVASWAVLATYIVWMFWIIWRRDSKGRWLSLAIIVQWIGVAVLYLPVVQIQLPDGKCAPVLELGKAFELAGLFFGLTATIWLAAGAWLTNADARSLEKINRQGQWNKFIGGLFKSAHRQIALGLITAVLGVALTLCSAGWELYTKLTGPEQSREPECPAKAP